MSAATTSRNNPTRPTGKQPICGNVQKAGTVIYKGCAAGHVAGVFQPMASGVAGLQYAGISEETYDCSGEGSNYTWPSPMVFKRVAAAFDAKSGDAPTAADLGKKTTVFLDDDQTLKVTGVTNDCNVVLIEIEGTKFWAEPV